jgi:formylglycine-generating enzyme required for sulfatase activity
MVVVPSGTFMMGSRADDRDRFDNEGPSRKVTIAKPFAVGRYEVTFAEWDSCASAGGCKYRPSDWLGSR